jgi:CPA2 family monovalent cation:H+ antiporter-2
LFIFKPLMNHLPELIRDLGLILIIAGITTLLFKKLRQPVVLGYLLAGLLVSPNFAFFPTVSDTKDIELWAEIGVIFLLFNLGLEFSFKKLINIGGAASITAFTEVSAMLVIGFLLGQVLGWKMMDCIFLGGILCISSTTIIFRAFDELGVKGKRFAQLVFGVLVIEDLVAVVLLVLLSTIALSRQFAGTEMLISLAKLSFFLLLWFVAGIFFIPTLLRKVQRFMSDETMLIVSIGLCLLMVILATQAGFSPALGAFIMGSILAETAQAERIERIIKPVKDLFGAVFFVSVGMLIDPRILIDYAGPILLITVVFIFFKTFHVTVGALIAGQPLKTALHAGMSQAQIGEFSFIIATLGLTLNVTSHFLYPIAVAVSALTTYTTPYMIRAAGPFYGWVEGHLPVRWKKTLTRYSAGTQAITQVNDWQLAIRAFFAHVLIFSIICLGIIFLFSTYVRTFVNGNITNGFTGNIITSVACLVVLSPFLWALVTRKFQTQAFANLWANRRQRGPLVFLRVIRGVLAATYIGIFLISFFSFSVAAVGVVLLVGFGIVFNQRIHAFYIQLEDRFFYNFHDRERLAAIQSRHELAPWDAHIAQFMLPMGSPVTGMSLEEMSLRERFGINIAMIKRGTYTISAPSRYERVYPGDVVFVIGSDEQLDQFKKHIEPIDGRSADAADGIGGEELVLKKLKVIRDSFLFDRTLRESGIREKTNGLVVGIERNNRRMLNPESNLILKDGDVLWIVGDGRLIDSIKKEIAAESERK